LAARLRRETTLTLPWIAARLQAGSWKSLVAKLHRWRKTHDSSDNESRLWFDPGKSFGPTGWRDVEN